MTPSQFIAAHFYVDPTQRVKLRDVLDAYRASLPPGVTCTRRDFLAAIRDHYMVAPGADNVMYIGGLGIDPPQAWLPDESGRLRLLPV